jgi:soluble lytic murein transglycosylase-like protein
MNPTSSLDARKGVACALIIAALLWLGLGRPFTADGPSALVAVEPDPRRGALATHLADRYDLRADLADLFVTEAHAAAAEAGVDPLLVLAVMAVESRFDPDAKSAYGAKGLMQIVPRFHRDKLDPHGGEIAILDPRVNVTVGTQILEQYVREAGSVQAGLQRYAGGEDDPDRRYARKVMAEKHRLQRVFDKPS